MVHPSILSALSLIKSARMGAFHSCDSDAPDWVTEVSEGVESEINSKHINLELIPSALEQVMVEAVTDWLISDNIQACIDDNDMRQHEADHWYP